MSGERPDERDAPGVGRPEGASVPRELARLLRQQAEIGGRELFLEGLTRAGSIRILETARKASLRSEVAGGRPDAADGGTAPRTSPAGRPAGAPDSRASGSAAAAASEDDPADGLEAELEKRDYEQVRELALGCTRCPLSETRTQVVFSDGSPDARLVVVGEAPGANEDREGLPFVGQAGKMLDLLLGSVGLSRGEDVYICNVLKCRPPGNRNPTPAEIEACSPYLRRQLALVSPQAVLAVGSFAGKLLTGTQSTLGRLRGEVYSYEGVPLVVTYHPAALLRNPGWTRPTWDDLQLLRGILDG